jgi:hypothetical protein
VIQVYRPSREIEEILSRDGSRVQLTDARLVDGRVENQIQLNGQPRMFTEDLDSVLRALRVTGAKLTGVELREGDIYYTLAEVGQAYMPAGLLEHDWWSRDHKLRTLTSVHLSGDGVDYELLDAGQPDVKHETERSVLQTLRLRGVRLTGAELRDGNVYYSVAESS